MSKLNFCDNRLLHGEIRIDGTVERLLVLRRAVEQALTQGSSSFEAREDPGAEWYQVVIQTIREQ